MIGTPIPNASHVADFAAREPVELPRRQFLQLTTGAFAFPAVSRTASARSYPERPVRVIIGFAPGGGVDIVARLIGQWLSERLRQPFIIENRPGAGSTIAAEAVVGAPADGYTLFWATSANAINATLYNNLSYNFVRDIAPVAGVIRLPNVMEVNLSVPVKTVSEFIAYAKTNPGKVNVATVSGTTLYMAGELFMMMTGVNMLQVPYRGAAAAVTDLLGGEMQVMFDILTGSMQYIKAGRLRALAVTSAARSEALPDIPTVGEFVPGYEASSWNGVGVPRNTPAEIVAKLNAEINAALADPNIKARLADLGGAPMPMKPAEFGALVVTETEKWAKVVKFSGVKPD
jgi:tripartite-type tricarboxylate transporter receptor subunit TctC